MNWKSWLGATALLASCAGFAADALAQNKVVVIMPGGQLVDTMKKAFEPFERDRNVKIDWVSAGSATEVVAKVAASKAAPDFDVAFADDASLSNGSKQGLWAPLDPALVPNVKDLVPAAVPPTKDGVGYAFFFGGMFYRVDEFEKNKWAPPTSWHDLFKPEFCNRAGFYHPNISYGLHMLIMLGGGDIANIDKGISELAAHRKCIPVLETSAAKFEEKVQLGDYVIGNIPAIRGIPLARRGVKIRFVVPKEGVVIAYATASAIKNDTNPERVKLAQEVVNWLIGPFAQETLMNNMFFNPSNSTVKVPPELVDAGLLSTERMKEMVTLPIDVVVKNRRDWSMRVDRVMSQ